MHLAAALFVFLRGVRVANMGKPANWDWFWQAIPVGDLLHRPVESFWYLHAQPPGFSVWGLVWVRVVGTAHFPAATQIGYVALGAAVALMTFDLVLTLTGSRRWALVAGIVVALNPALFLFEAYVLYEPLVLFLVVGSAWALARGLATGRRRWLVCFAAALVALTLTRSLYHLVFLAGALAFAWPMWRRIPLLRRWVFIALALLPTTLWYGKNAAQYGFFGASSWFGMGHYNTLVRGCPEWGFAELAEKGIIPPTVAALYPYQHKPDEYRVFGFDRESDVPLLGRNDFHNINVPEMSKVYAGAAKTLIRRDPLNYLRAVCVAYANFARPPSRFCHFQYREIYARIPWEWVFSGIIYGAWVTETVATFVRFDMGSLFYLAFPVLVVWTVFWVFGRRRDLLGAVATGAPANGSDESRARSVRALLVAYLLYVCVYVAAVGCLFECVENERFRFAIEPFCLILLVVAARDLLAWKRARQRQRACEMA